ncbi:UNVERIFIED_CONTAM: hypothetical protein RF648_04940 [Kocuria sp. CPCC 205274]
MSKRTETMILIVIFGIGVLMLVGRIISWSPDDAQDDSIIVGLYALAVVGMGTWLIVRARRARTKDGNPRNRETEVH